MSGRHPDLPILDELGAEFEELARAADPDGEPHRARKRLPARRARDAGQRRVQARRIWRRAAIVAVLVCLVGGGALAALRGGRGGDGDTSPTLLGTAPGGSWSFSAYRHDGRLCTVFMPRDGELSSKCGASPGRGQVWAGSSLAGGRRYAFGIVGSGVARISAALGREDVRDGAGPKAQTGSRAGGSPRPEFAIRAPADRDAARDAGFPAGDGWFVLDLGQADRADLDRSSVTVVPFTRRGVRAGAPYVDCSLGRLAPACRARLEAASARR